MYKKGKKGNKMWKNEKAEQPSNYDFVIVPEHLCGKSELELSHGLHLCKRENVRRQEEITISIAEFKNKLEADRPDLAIILSDITIDRMPIHDYNCLSCSDLVPVKDYEYNIMF